MATNVLMPQMGESINEGTLTKWHKKVGDKLQREEILFEISTDKVDTEIPSPVSGVLVQILANEGTVVAVNSVVAIVDESGAGASAAAPQAKVAPAAAAAPAAVKPAPAAAAPAPAAVAEVEDSNRNVKSSPLVRKMAAEHNIDLSKVEGTGENGRINKQDLVTYMEAAKSTGSGLVASAAQAAFSAVKTASAAAVDSTGGQISGLVDGVRVERVPMTQMRKKIAEHMVMSKRTSPHVTSVIEIDLQKIVDLRAKFKDKFESLHGFKLSFMPFFMHAALEGIKAVPIVNASVDGDTIVYKKDVNLGIAVALDWGLIVPVIKNSTERSFVGLARELESLANKARNKKLAPDDVKGGTFSISNFGGFGTIIGQPIINQPQVAIMGIGAMVKKPVVVNDAIAIRTTCHVVLSFDHRVIDGSDSGKFLSTVKNTLENWSLPVV
ncbi:MAG: 2-oxo acid dehydrogenase subunit E2 [Betaproteobacteria bacterium]|nr:2-oxo acid dehydrogenase subunit E2 [Betaproteobacteria bacterium]